MAILQLRRGSGAPASGALAEGEIAADATTGQIYIGVTGGGAAIKQALFSDITITPTLDSVTLTELGATPSNPASGSETRCYMKADKFVIQYNHGGTVKYRYLDLTSTDAVWTYTTSAP